LSLTLHNTHTVTAANIGERKTWT